MGNLDESARSIIIEAVKRLGNIRYVCRFYKVSKYVVGNYMQGKNNGTVNARIVMRVEMSRLENERKGNTEFVPSESDRYKGGRNQ